MPDDPKRLSWDELLAAVRWDADKVWKVSLVTGRLQQVRPPEFTSVEEAQAWLDERGTEVEPQSGPDENGR